LFALDENFFCDKHSTMNSPEGLFSRRHFLHGTAAGMALAVTGAAGESNGKADEGGEPKIKRGVMDCGVIGGRKISRLISGGNLLSGWCHQRDLLFVRQLAEAYLTEKKQFDSLSLMEEAGVNAIMIDMEQVPIVNKYNRERGGRLQMIVSVRQAWGQWGELRPDVLKTAISKVVDSGAVLVYLHGGFCDHLVRLGEPENLDFIANGLEWIRAKKLPAGLGAHELEVLVQCDKKKIQPDFFVKTFHHDHYWSATPKDRRKRFCVDGPLSTDHNEFHDNIFCIDPVETAEFMRDQEKPWIAFKVLAAGAIPPESGFGYAFENGADFIAVGMFDFNVVEDVALAQKLASEVKRDRPWRG